MESSIREAALILDTVKYAIFSRTELYSLWSNKATDLVCFLLVQSKRDQKQFVFHGTQDSTRLPVLAESKLLPSRTSLRSSQ